MNWPAWNKWEAVFWIAVTPPIMVGWLTGALNQKMIFGLVLFISLWTQIGTKIAGWRADVPDE